MGEKSILEQALLQVETLEEAVKANAKGILASTMKQELNDLLKEQEDINPEEDEKDIDGADAPEDNDDTSINDEPELDDESSEDIPDINDTDDELETDDDDVLDMTGASEEEVLKVFKAMKPEDGIVVKKDGNTVQFSDEGNDYIIKLEDEESPEETPELPSNGLEDPEFPEGLDEQDIPTNDPSTDPDEIVYEIELDEEDENQPFTEKGKKTETKEDVNVTDTVGDNDPFDKKSEAQVGKGVKKLQANEQEGIKRPGTPVPGTGNPSTKEPGKGGTKTTQAEKFDGTAPKGTDNPEKKEPGKGGTNATQVEDHPGTEPKGTGKPVMKEPKEGMEDCDECGDGEVKEVEATEAARTKWNPHGDKGGQDRAGIKSKKIFKAGSGNINEEVKILRKQNGEYKKALLLFKDKLNEVAIFNANLAYATRLFTEHSTTRQEKLNILKRFDSVSTITESKNLYTAIQGELDTAKPIAETVAEKIVTTPQRSSTEVLSEAKAYENPQFKRMKDLMNKIK